MATHSSVLAWRIPGTGEPGGLPAMGSHRVGHDWSDLAAATKTAQMVRQWSAYNAGDPGSIPGLGRSPGEGNGNLLQYSCLGNPIDRGAWWATQSMGLHKSWTWLSNWTRDRGRPWTQIKLHAFSTELLCLLNVLHVKLLGREDIRWRKKTIKKQISNYNIMR